MLLFWQIIEDQIFYTVFQKIYLLIELLNVWIYALIQGKCYANGHLTFSGYRKRIWSCVSAEEISGDVWTNWDWLFGWGRGLGEAGFMLVARRGGGSRQAPARCAPILSEATHCCRQVLPGERLVSLQNITWKVYLIIHNLYSLHHALSFVLQLDAFLIHLFLIDNILEF